jgi:O-antigen/teichoic acid export membrane protein
MLITNTNSILITKFIGPGSVVDYQIYYRLFLVPGMLFMLALTPMWSAITRAFEEKDGAWINKYFKLLNRLVMMVILCEFLIVPFLQILVNIWLGENTISINYINAMIFALFGSVFIYVSVLSTFACGMGKMKLQAIFFTIGVGVKFILIYIGFALYNNWIIIVISDIIILAPYCLFQSIALKKEFSKLDGVTSKK